MSEDRSRTGNLPTRGRKTPPSSRLFQIKQLRRLRDCQQVAAICYRIQEAKAQFLLVKTRGGRWTFPKGNTEPGLMHAEAAALEAFEEAGVHGRIEKTSFTQYIQPAARNQRSSAGADDTTVAHLCEVYWQEQPQERDRNPSWFSAEKAKRRLSAGRPKAYAAELARVVDCAMARIEQLQNETSRMADGLGRVHFIDNPRPITGKLKSAVTARKSRRNRPQIDIIPPVRVRPRV